MITPKVWILAAVSGAILSAGCEQIRENFGQRSGTENMPEPNARSVWKHVENQNYQRNWSYWPGKGELYKGTEPHGVLLTTYVNPLAQGALTNRAAELPAGAIIVKENYSPKKELAAVTVMYKARDGYNPDHNNWFWLKRLPDGKVEASGKAESCQACHGASKHDYLMTPLP